MTDLFARIESAAHSGASGINAFRDPTPGQQQAGNYRMGRVTVQGIPLVIEQPRNSYRHGTGKDGKAWRSRLAAHYGYIAKTKGADGDGLDVFIGPAPESEQAFVINQHVGGSFDEHKIMLGFLDADDAERAYRESYDKGWDGIGSMIPCSTEQLKWWIKNGDTTAALSASALPHAGNEKMIAWDSTANPIGTDLAGLIYELRKDDADGLMLDSLTTAEIMDGMEEVALDALIVPYAKLERKMGIMQTVMRGAGDAVKPLAVQVTRPFKQRGTTNVAAVFELSDGQTVSIFFHNPDTSPNKIMPTDEMVSWKWLLNKKDITILVAPERGADLNVREVARRIMRLAEKNSARFQQVNKDRAARIASIETMKAGVASKEDILKGLYTEIEELDERVAAKRASDAAKKSEPVAEESSEMPKDVRLVSLSGGRQFQVKGSGDATYYRNPESKWPGNGAFLLASPAFRKEIEAAEKGATGPTEQEIADFRAKVKALFAQGKIAEAFELQKTAVAMDAVSPEFQSFVQDMIDDGDMEIWALPAPVIKMWSADEYAAVIEALTDINYHTEAVIVEAKRLGNKQDVSDAESIRAATEKDGGITMELSHKRTELSMRLRGVTLPAEQKTQKYLYEVGNDDTSWNAAVVANGEAFDVIVWDADGDKRAEKAKTFPDLAAAKQYADRIVTRDGQSEEAKPQTSIPSAYEMGKAAFAAGLVSAPAANAAFNDAYIKGMGNKSNEMMASMAQYARGWHEANLAEPVPGVLSTRSDAITAITYLTNFLSKSQFKAIKEAMVGEEKQFFFDKLTELAALVKGMPETYGQDGKGQEAIAYLHYFRGGSDWYITEKDAGGGDDKNVQQQAFGVASLNGNEPEMGYISIAELVKNGVELDLNFTPKMLKELNPDEAPQPQSKLAKFMELSKQADGALWGVGSPDYYGVIQDEGGELPSDFMPENGNKQMAMDMGRMVAEHGRSIAVQIKPDSEKPFRVIIALYADGRGVGSQWAATADEAYKMVSDAKPIASFDPTSKDGYLQVMADEALQLKYQDALDSLFQDRLLQTRNALRDLGWEGERGVIEMRKTVGGSVHGVKFNPKQVGAGRNMIGIEWSVDGGTWKIQDRLTNTPAEIAASIDQIVTKADVAPSPDVSPETYSPKADETVAAPGLQEAKSYLQSVVDGQADFMDPDLADKLTQLHDKFSADPAFMELFNKAAEAFSGFMVNKAKNEL